MTVRTALIVVAAPVAAMGVWLLSLVIAAVQATEITLPVNGYDPRDLLSGHYLRYTVDYGIPVSTFNSRGGEGRTEGCVCLTPSATDAKTQAGTGIAKGSWFGKCSDRNEATCPLFIRGHVQWSSFSAGIERYYIPERYQDILARIPPNASIIVRVTSGGTAYVTGMLVEGQPILEWAAKSASSNERRL